jgi:hypothetical protein
MGGSAANPWLGAIARCSRTGSANPSPSSRESSELSVPKRRSPICRCDKQASGQSFDQRAEERSRTRSLADPVLPFTNMSGDAEQEYFSEGVTEDIITNLSRNRAFFVISRSMSFTYKGLAVDVGKVARELGVRYEFKMRARPRCVRLEERATTP